MTRGEDPQPSESEREGRAREVRERLSSGRTLARSTAFTLAGQVSVVLGGVLAVPLLIHSLGTARFGVLTLVWVVIGYASIFDLGLGRALTKLTAEKLGQGLDSEIPSLFWTALRLLGLLGIVAGTVVAAVSPWLVGDVLKIPSGLEGEARVTFLLLAGAIPFVLLSAALRGSLEARQRFDLTNAIAVPLSLLSYFGPVVIAQFTHNLAAAVSAVVLSRVIACAVNLALCLRVDPSLRGSRRFERALVKPLVTFGGWITLASIAGPMMLTLDRFIIGAIVSATAVAYYATPYEAVRQMLIVSASFSTVLFPAFSATVGADRERGRRLFGRGTRAVFVSLFPLTLTVVVFAHQILELWVGDEFAEHSTHVMQWLASGILMNGLAFVAFGMLQSQRPDLIAKLLFIELPLYLGSFWLLIHGMGIEGAAIAWAGRVTLDATAMYLILLRLKLIDAANVLTIVRPAAAALVLFGVGSQLSDLRIKLLFFSAAMVAFLWLAWFRILEDDDRANVRKRLRFARTVA